MSTGVGHDFRIGPGAWGVVEALPRRLREPVIRLISSAPSVGAAGSLLSMSAKYLWGEEDRTTIPTTTVESGPAPIWLNDVYSLVAADEPDEAIDKLFDHIDDHLLAGEFDACDDLLKVIDPKRLDTNLLVAALSVTKAAAAQLPSRARFVERVEKRLNELAPERLEALLSGLR